MTSSSRVLRCPSGDDFLIAMKILLVHQGLSVPVHSYGGTERVIWDLAKGLVALGPETERASIVALECLMCLR
jgi:hypothetical protein